MEYGTYSEDTYDDDTDPWELQEPTLVTSELEGDDTSSLDTEAGNAPSIDSMEYGTSSNDTNYDDTDPWDDPEDPNPAQIYGRRLYRFNG